MGPSSVDNVPHMPSGCIEIDKVHSIMVVTCGLRGNDLSSVTHTSYNDYDDTGKFVLGEAPPPRVIGHI